MPPDRRPQRFAALKSYGLDVRVLPGPPTAASAMKMSYAGITKGMQGARRRDDAGGDARRHRGRAVRRTVVSQAPMLAWLKRSLSMMPPKAYRWIAEMHEIADFVGEDPAGHELYVGAAHFYEQIARDFDGDKKRSRR